MTKKIQLLGKLYSLPHYRDGEFLVSAPEDLLSLDLKKSKDYHLNGIVWDPWPKEDGIVRLGRFFLRRDEKYSWTDRWNAEKVYARLIADVDEDGQPGEWMNFDWREYGNAATKQLKCYHGDRRWELLRARASKLPEAMKRVREEINEEVRRWVIAENFKAGEEKYSAKDRAWSYTQEKIEERVLSTTPEGALLLEEFNKTALGPYDITEDEVRVIFGIKKGEIPYSYKKFCEAKEAFWEFEYRERFLKLEIEWARKQLMKLQQAYRREEKKKVMAERDLSEEALAAEKAERERLERRVKRTQEWVKVAKDAHNTLDWLQEFIERMGRCEEIDQKWFDKNRRELRALATKMKPLSRVLND